MKQPSNNPEPKGDGSSQLDLAIAALKGWEDWWNVHGFEMYRSCKIFDPTLGGVRPMRQIEKPPALKVGPLHGISSAAIRKQNQSR